VIGWCTGVKTGPDVGFRGMLTSFSFVNFNYSLRLWSKLESLQADLVGSGLHDLC